MKRPGPMLLCVLICSNVLLLPEIQMPLDSWFSMLFWGTPITSRPLKYIQLPVTRNPVMRHESLMPEKSNTGISPGYAQYLIGAPDLPPELSKMALIVSVPLAHVLSPDV